MAQPYVGEIRMFAGDFQPVGWMFCEGQLLPISEHGTLFQLLGTIYGGDGVSSFALPDLRGRLPLHQDPDNGFALAGKGGVETVTLTVNQIPNHSHRLFGSLNNSNAQASGSVVSQLSTADLYQVNVEPNGMLNSASIASTGGSQPHSNFQPYLCVNFIISLFGIYPLPA